MPYNGSGTFARNYSWTAEAAAGKDISPNELDADANDLAGGLSNAITRDGQGAPAADIPWNGHKITDLKLGANPGDAATVDQVLRVDVLQNLTVAQMIQAAANLLGMSWETYTPTFGPDAGAFNVASATGRYLKLGRLVIVHLTLNVQDNGTGATAVQISLPVTSAFTCCAFGREQTNGLLLSCGIGVGTATMNFGNYDNSYPAFSGAVLDILATYESPN